MEKVDNLFPDEGYQEDIQTYKYGEYYITLRNIIPCRKNVIISKNLKGCYLRLKKARYTKNRAHGGRLFSNDEILEEMKQFIDANKEFLDFQTVQKLLKKVL